MANAKIGSYSSYNYTFIESIDTTGKQLTPGDSGKVFMCDQNSSADVDINLPQLSTSIAGWHAKFVMRTSSSNAFNIIAYGSAVGGATTGDSDKIVFLEQAAGASIAGAADVVLFNASNAEAGCYISIFTDGSKWYAHGRGADDNDLATVG